MSEPLEDPAERDNPPHAVVTKVGRWTYSITISAGITRYAPDGGWRRLGRGRARRKAERELRRFLDRQPPERFEVWRWGDLTGKNGGTP